MTNEHEAQPIHPETLQAFGNDALRARIFHEKYALRGADGTVREHLPAQMWQRISQGVAAVEAPEHHREWEAKFGWLLSDFRMVPGGRILHAIGNPNPVTALNCYVLPAPHDSLQGIYHTAWELAETFKRGGGCGVDLSSLRPKHAPVHNAARLSTGAVSFMELYSVTTDLIGQEGRRGALMLTLADSHPDVPSFLTPLVPSPSTQPLRLSPTLSCATCSDRAVPRRQRGQWGEKGCVDCLSVCRRSVSGGFRWRHYDLLIRVPPGDKPGVQKHLECCVVSRP